MNTFVKGAVAAAMTLLAGCASDERQGETFGPNLHSAAATMKACERAVYYSSETDRRVILDCANILDVWQ
jgi:hypothetical protein